MAEDNSVGVCGILEQFVEILEVEGLIRELPTYCSKPNELEFQKERFCKVLDYYQEQPHLIDPHLSSLLEKLVEQVSLKISSNFVYIQANPCSTRFILTNYFFTDFESRRK